MEDIESENLKHKGYKIILILCAVIAFIGIAFTLLYFYNEGKEKDLGDAIYTEEEYPIVDASFEVQPLADEFYKDFTGETSAERNQLIYTNTHSAYLKLIDDEVDLIIVTRGFRRRNKACKRVRSRIRIYSYRKRRICILYK